MDHMIWAIWYDFSYMEICVFFTIFEIFTIFKNLHFKIESTLGLKFVLNFRKIGQKCQHDKDNLRVRTKIQGQKPTKLKGRVAF